MQYTVELLYIISKAVTEAQLVLFAGFPKWTHKKWAKSSQINLKKKSYDLKSHWGIYSFLWTVNHHIDYRVSLRSIPFPWIPFFCDPVRSVWFLAILNVQAYRYQNFKTTFSSDGCNLSCFPLYTLELGVCLEIEIEDHNASSCSRFHSESCEYC